MFSTFVEAAAAVALPLPSGDPKGVWHITRQRALGSAPLARYSSPTVSQRIGAQYGKRHGSDLERLLCHGATKYRLVVVEGTGPRECRPDRRWLLAHKGVTRREADVLAAVSERLTNAEIATRLFISQRTVESHVASLLKKLQVKNRLDLAAEAKRALQHRPAPSALPPALELRADPMSYIGRKAQLEQLGHLWRQTESGRILVALVTGEAGIGKSRLVAEFAACAHARGAHVMFGSCVENLRIPYEAFAQALTDDAVGLAAAAFESPAGGERVMLTRIAPSLGPLLGVDLQREVGDETSEAGQEVRAVHRYLTARSVDAPVLLVIEDLHWASETTRRAVQYLATMSGQGRVLLAITTRDCPPDLSPSLARLLDGLRGAPAVSEFALDGLNKAELAAMLHQHGSEADAVEVLHQTDGNPLLIREIARRGAPRDLGGSMQSLLMSRYALLESADLDALDLAAVIGAEFDARFIAKVLDVDVIKVIEAMERAEDAGLVAASPDHPGHFAFVHELFRSARYERIPYSKQLRLHHCVAKALLPRCDDERYLPIVAHHAAIAAPIGDASFALDVTQRAAESARRSLAHDEAAALYRTALELVELLDPPDPQLRLWLLIRLGETLNRAGDPAHRALLLEAATDARRLGDGPALAAITWALVQFGASQSTGTDAEFVAVAEDALAFVGSEPTALRARTLAALSADLGLSAETDRAFALATEALAIARQLDDPVLLGQVLLAYRFSARAPDNAESRHPTSDELITLGRRLCQPMFTIFGMVNKAWCLWEEGRLDEFNETVEQYAALMRDRVIPPNAQARLIMYRAARLLMAGDLAAAEEQAAEVLTIQPNARFDPAAVFGPPLMKIRHLQGRLPELLGLLDTQPDHDVFQIVRALMYAHDGRLDDAHSTLEMVLDRSMRSKNSMFWFATLTLACEAAEMTNSIAAATKLGAALEPYSGLLATVPTVVIGPVDFGLAQCALTCGDGVGAMRLAERAAQASRARGMPPFLGRELVLLAEVRRRCGGPSDEVGSLVDEALAIANATCARVIHQDAQRYGLL